jgi:hypothetical protein
VLYRLHKDDLTPLLKSNEEVAKQMCQLLSRRQDALSRLTTPIPEAHVAGHSAFQWLLDKIQQLHSLRL